ncbi:MAG: ParA family protein [Gammaproteobacteria bacterium]|nr:ParA family protein [Gammaproteobacteria bacterium]
MAIILGCVSQKGGVAKSTIARLMAREFAIAGWNTLIADLDNKQLTSTDWAARRNEAGIEPAIASMPLHGVDQVPYDAYDAVIFDGRPHSSKETLAIAKIADFIIIPSGVSEDDLKPAVLLGHEMMKHNISAAKFSYALCRYQSEGELRDARQYIDMAGYKSVSGALPERIAYRNAQNDGRAVSETAFSTLNVRAVELAQNIIDRLTEKE